MLQFEDNYIYIYIHIFQGVHVVRASQLNLSSSALKELPRLRILSINNCQLSIAPSIHAVAETLIILDIRLNKLQYLPFEYFRDFKVLERINLSKNLLTTLPNVQNLSDSLRELHVRGNRLINIESLYCASFEKLDVLDLAKNLLTNISFHKSKWPTIKKLHLDMNNLASIDVHGMTTLGEGVYISVDQNPWHCDHTICWLADCHFTPFERIEDAFTAKCDVGRSNDYSFDYRIIQLSGNFLCNSPEELNGTIITKTGK